MFCERDHIRRIIWNLSDACELWDYGSASSGRKDTGRNAAGDGKNPGTHEESGCGRIWSAVFIW